MTVVVSSQTMVAITTKKLETPMMIHSNTASTSGVTPTLLIIFIDRLAPMKNKVTISSF